MTRVQLDRICDGLVRSRVFRLLHLSS